MATKYITQQKHKYKYQKRLLGLQTSSRAEVMVSHEILRLITTNYSNDPARIFTDCFNCVCVLITQIKYLT